MLLRRSCSACKPLSNLHSLKRHSAAHSPSSRPLTGSSVEFTTRHGILTLLHKTTSLLPRVLESKSDNKCPSYSASLEFWADILLGAYEDVTSTADRPARIAVYGIDQWSGARDLITAILDEPLSSDESQNRQIRDRWANRTDQTHLTISHTTPESMSSTSVLHVQSPYLLQFLIPLQIIEIPPPDPLSSHDNENSFLPNKQASEVLFRADKAIVVCNPLTTPLSPLLRTPLLANNPNSILVLTSAPSHMEEHIKESVVSPRSSDTRPQGPKIIFMDPTTAARATESLRADPRSPPVIQKYQDDFIASGVPRLATTLKAAFPSGAESSLESLRTQTSLTQIGYALSACETALRIARRDMESVSAGVSQLSRRVEEAKAVMQVEIFGGAQERKSSTAKDEGYIVDIALKQARKEMKGTMDRLTWWRMVWRVDEISHTLGRAMSNAWCRALERQLILQTGHLSALQSDLANSTFALLATYSKPPFNSAILSNTLRQIISSPSYKLTPLTLTAPITLRNDQIIQYPTTRLHHAGQQAVLGMTSGIVTGAGLGWAGWIGWLAGTGEGLLSFMGLDAGTSMGVGALGAVAGLRWAVGKWERAKRRWWEDWNRVGDGLERDLKTTLDKTMQENVLIVAKTCCDSLSDLAVKRRVEIEKIEDEIDSLRRELQNVTTQATAAKDSPK